MNIVRDTAGCHYSVVTAAPGLEHCWLGTPVKRTAAGYIPKAKARQILVRRAGCVIIQGATLPVVTARARGAV
jgi:hypothetical protein